MRGSTERRHDESNLEAFSTSPLGSFPPDVLRRVFGKLSCMSATLCEIEEWLDTRNSVPVSGGVTGGHGALPHGEKLTLENLESVVERERASGTS